MSNTAIKDWEKSGQKHGAISVRMVTVLSVVLLMLTFSAALPIGSSAQSSDPLPSWNDGAVKQSITGFVKKVTTQSNSNFVSATANSCTANHTTTLSIRQKHAASLW